MSKSSYRTLWEEYYGKIPQDENGISFDIHHINGNHSDDRIENLQCVSIKDHYSIHEAQGDILACCAISRRMAAPLKLTDEQKLTLSEQATIAAKKRVDNGTHNFLGGDTQRKHQKRRKEEGTHNFLISNPSYLILADGTKETIFTCIDKSGNKTRITKTKYTSQTGKKEDYEYVTYNSDEGLKRLGKTRKERKQTSRTKESTKRKSGGGRKQSISYENIISLVKDNGFSIAAEILGLPLATLKGRHYNALRCKNRVEAVPAGG